MFFFIKDLKQKTKIHSKHLFVYITMTSSYKNIELRKRFVLIFQFLYNLIEANYSKLKQRSIEIDFSSYNLKTMNLELSTNN